MNSRSSDDDLMKAGYIVGARDGDRAIILWGCPMPGAVNARWCPGPSEREANRPYCGCGALMSPVRLLAREFGQAGTVTFTDRLTG